MESLYKPFESDTSDSETDSDGYTSEESLINIPGKKPPVATGGAAAPSTLGAPPPENNGTKFEEQAVVNSNLFMINSRDRDTTAYPQPTNFSIRLPRVFKNIKKINISQLNLLNSFFNFSKSSGNTFMYVQEQGRPAVEISIPDGTYSASDLVTALTNALNNTPLFADITLNTFISGFQATGDYSPLFNTPGSVVYNSLTQTYDQNQTINNIISRYFRTSESVGTINYTYNESLVAYYYPVMKEMIIAGSPFNTSIVFQTTNEAYTYIVFYFTGLDDQNILALASDKANQILFDTYRYKNTFNLALTNTYVCNYNTNQGRLVINAPSLNASISSDLTNQYNSYLSNAVLSNAQFTDVNDFFVQYSNITNTNTALISFYNFIQSRFTSNFGINFGTYSAGFYATPTNEITLYNILNRYGWSPTITASVSASTISSNTPAKQVPVLLSNIVMQSTVSTFISTFKIPNVISFSNAGETTLGYFDIPFTVQPTTYERIEFNTQFRQTISMMTIPRYINDRSTNTDLLYNMGPLQSQTPLLYDYRLSTFYNNQYSTIFSSFIYNNSTITSNLLSTFDNNLYLVSTMTVLPLSTGSYPTNYYSTYANNIYNIITTSNNTLLSTYVYNSSTLSTPRLSTIGYDLYLVSSQNQLFAPNNYPSTYYSTFNKDIYHFISTTTELTSTLLSTFRKFNSTYTSSLLTAYDYNLYLLSTLSTLINAGTLPTHFYSTISNHIYTITTTSNNYTISTFTYNNSTLTSSLLSTYNNDLYLESTMSLLLLSTGNYPMNYYSTLQTSLLQLSTGIFPDSYFNTLTSGGADILLTKYTISSSNLISTGLFNNSTYTSSILSSFNYNLYAISSLSTYLATAGTFPSQFYSTVANNQINLIQTTVNNTTTNTFQYNNSTIERHLLSTFDNNLYLISSHNVLYNYGQQSSFIVTHEYNRLDISGNSLFNLYEVEQNMFNSPDYMRNESRWATYMISKIISGQRLQPENINYGKYPPTTDIQITSYRPFVFLEVNAAAYLSEPRAHFNITLYIETQDGANFPVPLVAVWYKDRAAFMSDVQNGLTGEIGSENPENYFISTVVPTTTNSYQMVVDVNNNQVSYFYIHINPGSAILSAIPLRFFCLLTDTYGTYTIATQEQLSDLPVSGKIDSGNTPASLIYQPPNASIYNSTTLQLGYDISGVSNNLLDYTIQAGNKYYDPVTISDFISSSKNGLQYQFVLSNSGAPQPAPDSTSWSLFFGSNSSNVILDTYNTKNNVYLSSLQTPKPLQPGLQNEFTLVNWFAPGNPNNPEMYYTPRSTINSTLNYSQFIGNNSIFLSAQNNPPLASDMSTPTNFVDISGFAGLSFFLPPDQIVQLDNLVIKFVYTQPSIDTSNIGFSRSYSPFGLSGQVNTNVLYRNQTTNTLVSSYRVSTATSTILMKDYENWDDFYLMNRANIKLGIFETSALQGENVSSILLSNAITSLTLSQIIQVNNYQYSLGTLKTREPEWGTYYKYTFSEVKQTIWDVATMTYTPSISTFRENLVDEDFAPSFVNGASTYTNYFLTNPVINNYSYLPRSYGLAPSVANALTNPTTISTIASDIPNSYTVVPFYFNAATSTYQVGCFHGLSFTFLPCLPSTNLTGASPYFGPMGPFGWHIDKTNTFTQVQHEVSTLGSYYWNAKLNYNTLDLSYDPANDLTVFGGYSGISGEFQKTGLFIYSNAPGESTDLNDVLSNGNWIWGQESNANYLQEDFNSGYNFLSYIHNYTIRSGNTYAIHVRGYDPIPRFTTGIRFIGKNYTDFGALNFIELAQEISSLQGYIPITDISGSFFNSQLVTSNYSLQYNKAISTNNYYLLSNGIASFSHTYADALINFDKTFSTSITFGKTNSYAGLSYTFTGYGQAINSYVTLYSTTLATLFTYNNILSTATGQLGEYVIQRYGNILPSSIVTRNRTTDPLPFSFLFSTYTLPPYKNQYDEWGLGYNLGFNKQDTPTRVAVTSDTFIRIVQSYIYLRINPELNINTMAVSGKETLADTRESQGQDSKYFSKILLNDFGSFSSTAVQRPKEFNPVLGRYEVISCQLTDKYGNQLSSLDCEYDFVLQIDEMSNGPKDSSSLLGPTSDLNVYKARM